MEVLEGRQLLTASLAPITSVSPPAGSGYQLPLLAGSNSTTSNQTFTATSSNPNIKVSVAPQVVGTQEQFWTITVSHKAANSSDVTINNERMTFQLFGDLTPQTVAMIATLSNPSNNYYTTASTNGGPGEFFPRITSVANFGYSVLQGGSTSATSTGTGTSSTLTPIATEPVQQLAFTGQNQLAMANSGSNPSTDAQFFITNGTLSQSIQQQWDYNYTIFGQLVSGQQTVTDLSKVAVQNNSSTPPEDWQPITPVVIDSATFSSTNANGVLHIDTTGATAGQTATITVTATDPTDHTTATRSFTVTTAGNTGAVHLIDNDVLVVTPPPRTDHGTDNIEVSQQNPTGTGTQSIVATVNGVPDVIQPPANSLSQIVVFGGKANTDIQVDPNVSPTIPITLDGGHGGDNVIQAGSGPTREHGWFGHTLLIGGTGSNELIGRKGFVRFKPTTTTNLIYAGVIKPRFKHRTVAPSGTYYRYVNGRLVPVLTT